MSLPACQERILSRIEAALGACEPRLAARFAIFTRLSRDEALPRREQIQPQTWLMRVAGAFRVSFRRGWRAGGVPGRSRVAAGLRAAVLLPIVLVVMGSAVVAASFSSSHTCAAASTRTAVVWPRWNPCPIGGALAHVKRGAGTGTAGTGTGSSVRGTGLTGTPR